MYPVEHDETAIQAELDRYQFMPGWTFTVTSNPMDPFGWSVLVIKAVVEDAQHPGVRQQLTQVASVPPGLVSDPAHFAEWLRGTLITVWMHEIDEWLRRDGQYVHDPHPELRNRQEA